MTRIGYLVPEFPGQTHAFFWREIAELEQLGVQVDLVSTRRPSRGLAPHAWAHSAISRTTYLYPPTLPQSAGAAWRIFKAGPANWAHCGAAIANATRSSFAASIRTAGLALMGARLAALAQSRGWDHLHVHSCADAALSATFAHQLCGLPYSLTLHGDLNGYGGSQNNKWKHADFAVVVCSALRRQVADLIGPDEPTSILVAPMGVDVDAFRRRTPYLPYLGMGAMRLFSCGRLHPGKGHEDVIRAVSTLHRQGMDLSLTIAGDDAHDGNHRRHLEAVIAETGLQSRVHLTGSLSEHEVRSQLEQSHLFVLASHQEALGVATMEAMAMELPVIVTRTGGVPELVEDGCDGRLVEPHRHYELAQAIWHCAQSPAECVRMGRCGRHTIETRFHSGISAHAIVKGIEQARARRSERTLGAPQAATP